MEPVMADSTEGQKMASSAPELHTFAEIIKKSTRIEEGTPTRFHLNPETNSHDESESFRKITFGEKDKNKPHKTILMVGEIGTGKTKLINVMINYMLDVKRKDKVWFEITDDQSKQTQTHSQTSIITVYGFYLPESKTDLTIIDTPGYGDKSAEIEKEIAMSLLKLTQSAEGIHEIDAVCLVIKSTQTRISEREIYIFDAVQSLFGRDIAENIVLLFTHSRGAIPKNVLTAVEENKIKCAVNEENQPVFFLFDNCQSDAADEEDEIQEHSWKLSFRGMEGFFKVLNSIKPKTLQLTQDVLQQRDNLEAKISEIQSHIQNEDRKKNELKQIQEALLQIKEQVDGGKTVEVISIKTAISNLFSKVTLYCTICEETCDPGCWWIGDLSECSVMKDKHCTVCTNKCNYRKHIKRPYTYEKKTKNEQTTKENSDKESDFKTENSMSSIKKLKEELYELEKKEIKLVMEAFHCVETLEKIALNIDSLLTLQHVDFLIEKLKEINEPEKVKTLENIKEKAGEEKNNQLKYMKSFKSVKLANQNSAL